MNSLDPKPLGMLPETIELKTKFWRGNTDIRLIPLFMQRRY